MEGKTFHIDTLGRQTWGRNEWDDEETPQESRQRFRRVIGVDSVDDL